YPQLLASTALVKPDNTAIIGHEGSWAPDGMTYYGMDARFFPAGAIATGQYYAVDTTDTTKPKFIMSWQKPVAGGNHHGLSISQEGNRGYFVSTGGITPANLNDPTVPDSNGLLIYDLTDVQARRPNPQARLVSRLLWRDGGGAQHTIQARIKGK